MCKGCAACHYLLNPRLLGVRGCLYAIRWFIGLFVSLEEIRKFISPETSAKTLTMVFYLLLGTLMFFIVQSIIAAPKAAVRTKKQHPFFEKIFQLIKEKIQQWNRTQQEKISQEANKPKKLEVEWQITGENITVSR